jgi:hypothetical protein
MTLISILSIFGKYLFWLERFWFLNHFWILASFSMILDSDLGFQNRFSGKCTRFFWVANPSDSTSIGMHYFCLLSLLIRHQRCAITTSIHILKPLFLSRDNHTLFVVFIKKIYAILIRILNFSVECFVSNAHDLASFHLQLYRYVIE